MLAFLDHIATARFASPEHRGLVLAGTDAAGLLDQLDAWQCRGRQQRCVAVGVAQRRGGVAVEVQGVERRARRAAGCRVEPRQW